MIHSVRGALVLFVLTGIACTGAEKKIIDQYFSAVQKQDDQTLSSFAAVKFEEKVDSWTVGEVISDTKEPLPLPQLEAKVRESEAAIAENKAAATAYFSRKPNEVEQVREISKKSGTIPPKLASTAADWEKFHQKEKELRRRLSEAEAALEKEKRHLRMSVNATDDGMSDGEVETKKVQVTVKSNGQPQSYVVTLRRYLLKGKATRSRWVVSGLSKA